MKKVLLILLFIASTVVVKAQVPSPIQMVFDSKAFTQATEIFNKIDAQLTTAENHYKNAAARLDSINNIKNKVTGYYDLAKKNYDSLRKVSSFHEGYYVIKDVIASSKSLASELQEILKKYSNSPDVPDETKKWVSNMVTEAGTELSKALQETNDVYFSKGEASPGLTGYERIGNAKSTKKQVDKVEEKIELMKAYLDQEKANSETLNFIYGILKSVVSGQGTDEFFKGIKSDAIKIAENLAKGLTILWLIIFGTCVAWKISLSKKNGSPIDLSVFHRPLILGFFIACYPLFIAIIHLVFIDPMNTYTANLPGGPIDTIEKLKQAWTSPARDNVNWLNPVAAIKELLWQLKSTLKLSVWTLLSAMIAMLSLVPKTIVIMLIIFGPISITLSMIPSFKDSVIKWLKSLLAVSLWVPIANIMLAVVGQLYDKLAGLYSNQGIAGSYVMAPFYMILVLILYICVPKMASALVGEVNGLGQVMGTSMQAVISSAGSALNNLKGKK